MQELRGSLGIPVDISSPITSDEEYLSPLEEGLDFAGPESQQSLDARFRCPPAFLVRAAWLHVAVSRVVTWSASHFVQPVVPGDSERPVCRRGTGSHHVCPCQWSTQAPALLVGSSGFHQKAGSVRLLLHNSSPGGTLDLLEPAAASKTKSVSQSFCSKALCCDILP